MNNNFDTANLVFNFINAGVLIATLVYVLKDLKISRTATESQNIMSLIEFLQDEDTRQARTKVIKVLSKKKPDSFSEWSEEEKRCADKVCATYDIAAMLIRMGFADKKIFTDNWGTSIRKCYLALEQRIKYRRSTSDQRYWNDFEWLYNQVIEWEKQNPGAQTS